MEALEACKRGETISIILLRQNIYSQNEYRFVCLFAVTDYPISFKSTTANKQTHLGYIKWPFSLVLLLYVTTQCLDLELNTKLIVAAENQPYNLNYGCIYYHRTLVLSLPPSCRAQMNELTRFSDPPPAASHSHRKTSGYLFRGHDNSTCRYKLEAC